MDYLHYNNFYSYMEGTGIIIVKDKVNFLEGDITFEKALSHISILAELHKKIMGYEGSMGFNLKNNTGRYVESCKVDIKKHNRYIRYIENRGYSNDFEKLILKYGDKYIKRAEKCIECVYSFNYIDLIYRSMKRNEICLGDSSIENLRKGKYIEVRNLKDFSYDLIEIDGVNFIRDLRKRGLKLDWENLIEEFCKAEGLNEDSVNFIKAMASYPYEFMRCMDRYKNGKKPWTLKQYESRLLKAIEKDGESLI